MFGVLKTLRRFFEYPQHVFWLKNKKSVFLLRKMPDVCIVASSYHSQCLKMTPDNMYRSSFLLERKILISKIDKVDYKVLQT